VLWEMERWHLESAEREPNSGFGVPGVVTMPPGVRYLSTSTGTSVSSASAGLNTMPDGASAEPYR
jgi:hypothetical protein